MIIIGIVGVVFLVVCIAALLRGRRQPGS